jgi:transcriptional regulator with XRE-family HTH domain
MTKADKDKMRNRLSRNLRRIVLLRYACTPQELQHALLKLSGASGISISTLRRYERGETFPSGASLGRLAEALKTKSEKLLA